MNDYLVAGCSVVLIGAINYLWEWLDHHAYDEDAAKRFDNAMSAFHDVYNEREFPPLPSNPFTRYHLGEPGKLKNFYRDADLWHKVKKVVIAGVIIFPTISGGLLWQNKPVLFGTMILWAVTGKMLWKFTQKW